MSFPFFYLGNTELNGFTAVARRRVLDGHDPLAVMKSGTERDGYFAGQCRGFKLLLALVAGALIG